MVSQVAKKLLSDLECSDAELSILFVTDDEIQKLNYAFRGKDKATDVLSFPQNERIGEMYLLGDVVISLETAKRQADELGHCLWYETVRLLVHGVLHLLGYEHEDVDEAVAQEMVAKETELLDRLESEGLLDWAE